MKKIDFFSVFPLSASTKSIKFQDERKSSMRECKYEEFIDDYLLNRLPADKRDKLEEHYFNCYSCFKKIAERDELISVVKSKGHMIFQDEYQFEEAKRTAWFEKIVSFLTPKQWALAAVSAAVLLIVIISIAPNFKTPAPQFYINDDSVRGEKIDLISPVMDINAVPSQFKWAKSDRDFEYIINLYNNGDILWTTKTKENFVVIPEEVKKLMTSCGKYSWQVRAFSEKGTLVAVSSKVQFKIAKTE